jgi:hypothetical protein
VTNEAAVALNLWIRGLTPQIGGQRCRHDFWCLLRAEEVLAEGALLIAILYQVP